jgi:hypothetical protein
LVAHPKCPDSAGAHLLFEKCKPSGARIRFAESPACAPAPRSSPLFGRPHSRGKLDPQGSADLPAKDGVRTRRSASQTVVEMKNANSIPARRPVRPNQKKERDRVRSPGAGDRPAFARGPCVCPCEGGRMQQSGRNRIRHGRGSGPPAGIRNRLRAWLRCARHRRINGS